MHCEKLKMALLSDLLYCLTDFLLSGSKLSLLYKWELVKFSPKAQDVSASGTPGQSSSARSSASSEAASPPSGPAPSPRQNPSAAKRGTKEDAAAQIVKRRKLLKDGKRVVTDAPTAATGQKVTAPSSGPGESGNLADTGTNTPPPSPRTGKLQMECTPIAVLFPDLANYFSAESDVNQNIDSVLSPGIFSLCLFSF